MEFRKDINGLRAIAVLAVMLYHFGLGGFKGGYAGVDVFFVISGFLMTGIILSRKNFSLLDFYSRRARRIVPALIVLCIVLLAGGYFWLIPSDYKTLGSHAAGALTFTSNFIFKGEDGYFDAPMRDKWLLHTWSLAVEWQFYLLYPLFLLRVRSKKAGILALGLGALTLCIYMTPLKSAFAFYLLPTRIWEFMAGAHICLMPKSRLRASTVAFLGLALIFASFFIFNDDTPWPGYAAFVPVIGTALVILAAQEKPLLTNNAPLQWLGEASYSIYLWHWPLFVGMNYFGVAHPALGAITSIVLGSLSYTYIEVPTRKKSTAPQLATAAAFTAAAGLIVFLSAGMPARVEAEIQRIDKASLDRENVAASTADTPANAAFILWGDSHADMLAGAAAAAAHAKGVVYTTGCPPMFDVRTRSKEKSRCKESADATLEKVKALPAHIPVIVASRYSYYLYGHNQGLHRAVGLVYLNAPGAKPDDAELFKKTLADSLCTMAATKHPIYAVKPIPEIGYDVPKTMARRLMAGRALPSLSVTPADYAARNQSTLEALETARKQCGIRLLDPLPALCDKNNVCKGTDGMTPLYFDDNHLTTKGALRLVPLLKQVFRAGAP